MTYGTVVTQLSKQNGNTLSEKVPFTESMFPDRSMAFRQPVPSAVAAV